MAIFHCYVSSPEGKLWISEIRGESRAGCCLGIFVFHGEGWRDFSQENFEPAGHLLGISGTFTLW